MMKFINRTTKKSYWLKKADKEHTAITQPVTFNRINMKAKNLLFLLICTVILQLSLSAQKKKADKAREEEKSDIKFGKITSADFDLTAEKYDSGASAVVIADIGDTHFEGNSRGDFSMIFTRFMRVKIINKNGFDIADNRIRLYNDMEGNIEKISNLRGSTFNMENGQVTETKLDDKQVFTEQFDRNNSYIKFTMPALKEGSVYDLSYTIKSPFYYDLKSWNFQGIYARPTSCRERV